MRTKHLHCLQRTSRPYGGSLHHIIFIRISKQNLESNRLDACISIKFHAFETLSSRIPYGFDSYTLRANLSTKAALHYQLIRYLVYPPLKTLFTVSNRSGAIRAYRPRRIKCMMACWAKILQSLMTVWTHYVILLNRITTICAIAIAHQFTTL